MNTFSLYNEKADKAVWGWITDGSHSWLIVNLDTEGGFPLAEKFAGKFSFIDNFQFNFAGAALLEEDDDAPAFLARYGLSANGRKEIQAEEGYPYDLPAGEGEWSKF